jgi:hypothetical protein
VIVTGSHFVQVAGVLVVEGLCVVVAVVLAVQSSQVGSTDADEVVVVVVVVQSSHVASIEDVTGVVVVVVVVVVAVQSSQVALSVETGDDETVVVSVLIGPTAWLEVVVPFG